MDDSDDDEHDDTSNDHIKVNLARSMLQYGRNSEKAMASFTLDFREWKSAEAIEFAGDALRSNTRIEHFAIDLRGNPYGIEETSLDDLLYFVVNNHSLRSLEVHGCSARRNGGRHGGGGGGATELCKLIMEAASGNHSIEAMCFGGRYDEPASCLPTNWEPITTCRELALYGFSVDMVWPEKHAIEILRLGQSNDQSNYEYQNILAPFLKKLAKCAGSKTIQILDIDGWCSTLPMFLSSPHTAIHQLELYTVDFCHSDDTGCSAMDGLLWGLMQSPTTTHLDLESCDFDDLATEKLLDALKANWLPNLHHLSIFQDDNFLSGPAIRDLLVACECLDTLGLKTEDEDVETTNLAGDGEFLREGLEHCSLSEVRLTTSRIESLCPALGTALSANSLRKLELSNCRFSPQGLGCLVSLIQNDNCHLLELAMVNYYWAPEEDESTSLIESTIFDAIEGKTNRLEKLIWGELTGEELYAVVDAMQVSLGRITTLQVLELSSSAYISLERSDAIANAMSHNWSLERLMCVVAFDTHPEPIGTSRLQRQLHEYSQRNQLKKQIYSPAFASLTKRECLDMMETLWTLPDSLTLAFLLIQQAPHHFFRTVATP